MKRIIAIDPGTTKSGIVILNGHDIMDKMIIQNEELVHLLSKTYPGDTVMVYEMIGSYGMAVGASVFETCVWIGRFIQAFHARTGVSHKLYRRDVKHYLCNSSKATDANVRRALLDKYPATGGGKTPQVGTKNQPGPLYGISADMWAALGLGITFRDTVKHDKPT